MLAAALLACLLAQAEDNAADPARAPPAPPGPPTPTPSLQGDAEGPNAFGVAGRFAYRLNRDAASPSVPSAGLSLGASFEHRYATLGGALELGAALDMFFDRFSSAGDLVSAQGTTIQETSFVALQTAAVRVGGGPRVWAGLGGGLGVGGLADSTIHALARGAGGLEIPLRGAAALLVMADYTRTLASQSRSDLFDAGAVLLYRF
jgi:hypothetical protein